MPPLGGVYLSAGAEPAVRSFDPELTILGTECSGLLCHKRGGPAITEAGEGAMEPRRHLHHQMGEKRAVDDQTAVAFFVTSIVGIVVDAVAVEGQGRVPEELGWRKSERLGFHGDFWGCLRLCRWRVGGAIDEFLPFRDRKRVALFDIVAQAHEGCLLYTSPSPRDRQKSRMPSSA